MFVDLSTVKKLLYPAPPAASATVTEIESRKALFERFKGTIVFDSNRNGNFSLFELDLISGLITEVVSGAPHALYPDVLDQTGDIVFAQATSTDRLAPATIWLLKRDSLQPEKIAENGTFPTFSADGTRVYFERNRKTLVEVNLITGVERILFSGSQNSFGSYAVVKPRVSPDDTKVLFTSDKGGRWNLWCADLATQSFHHVIKGCEGVWFPDSTHAAWIRKYGLLGNVGIYTINAINPGPITVLQDDPPPFGHEYFPSITSDGKYVLYAACPNYQHDHTSAQYQLFAREIASGVVTRITFDQFTNRWPRIRFTPP